MRQRPRGLLVHLKVVLGLVAAVEPRAAMHGNVLGEKDDKFIISVNSQIASVSRQKGEGGSLLSLEFIP